ncbi:MAG TPA: hypothetical protein VJ761_22260, partial [Ktedonobacteraceae bacterium]|nr:hypothetical protein [Ktedonobacteraceae bacterium]
MNLPSMSSRATFSIRQDSTDYRRLPDRWLMPVRGMWLILIILTLAVFFASLPMYLAQLETPCSGTTCWYTQLSPAQVGALKEIGLSVDVYAGYTVALTLASVGLCLVVSTLIAWRRADDRMALLVALLLVAFGPIYATSSVVAIASPWQVPNACLYFLAFALFMLVFLQFPSGQFVPRWMRWTLVLFLAGLVPTAFIAPLAPNTPVDRLTSLASIGELAILAIVQLYRYRRVSSPLQRQQTKWVIFGIAASVAVPVSGSALVPVFPVLAEPGSLYPVALNMASTIGLLFIPLSFGFAMLRSRLWEIDALINRTLVYGTLTVILAVVYAALVIGLQALLRGIISQNNGIAIVISTLAIAALFQPLHRGIQRIIDRRFYRHKYDAARTLAAFGATLRNEVDLQQLREHLVAVVEETMQPTFVSLWLRPPEHESAALRQG